MTVKIPPENILDKILKLMGKERRVLLPEETDEIYKDKGPYVQIKARRESFLKALMRSKSNHQ